MTSSPFLNPYFSRFGACEVKLLVSSYYKSSKINGFSFAEHRRMEVNEVEYVVCNLRESLMR